MRRWLLSPNDAQRLLKGGATSVLPPASFQIRPTTVNPVTVPDTTLPGEPTESVLANEPRPTCETAVDRQIRELEEQIARLRSSQTAALCWLGSSHSLSSVASTALPTAPAPSDAIEPAPDAAATAVKLSESSVTVTALQRVSWPTTFSNRCCARSF